MQGATHSYDPGKDTLSYSEDAPVSETVTVDRATIRLGSDGRIVGIELEDATAVLSQAFDREVSQDDMETIQDVSVGKKREGDTLAVIISIELQIDGDQRKGSIAVQL
jgi:uncharacterized protein YuzE